MPNFKPDVSTWLEDIALEVKITGVIPIPSVLPSSVSGVYNPAIGVRLSGEVNFP